MNFRRINLPQGTFEVVSLCRSEAHARRVATREHCGFGLLHGQRGATWAALRKINPKTGLPENGRQTVTGTGPADRPAMREATA